MPPSVPPHWPEPLFGDVMRCRFPFNEHHGQPNHEWHPCIVWMVAQSNQVPNTNHLVFVSFGTTILPNEREINRVADNAYFIVNAQDSKDDPARTQAGLPFTTTFWLMKEREECLRWIPYNDEWFVPIEGRNHPRHGSLRMEFSTNQPPPDDKRTIWYPPVGTRLLAAAKLAGLKFRLEQEQQLIDTGAVRIG